MHLRLQWNFFWKTWLREYLLRNCIGCSFLMWVAVHVKVYFVFWQFYDRAGSTTDWLRRSHSIGIKSTFEFYTIYGYIWRFEKILLEAFLFNCISTWCSSCILSFFFIISKVFCCVLNHAQHFLWLLFLANKLAMVGIGFRNRLLLIKS